MFNNYKGYISLFIILSAIIILSFIFLINYKYDLNNIDTNSNQIVKTNDVTELNVRNYINYCLESENKKAYDYAFNKSYIMVKVDFYTHNHTNNTINSNTFISDMRQSIVNNLGKCILNLDFPNVNITLDRNFKITLYLINKSILSVLNFPILIEKDGEKHVYSEFRSYIRDVPISALVSDANIISNDLVQYAIDIDDGKDVSDHFDYNKYERDDLIITPYKINDTYSIVELNYINIWKITTFNLGVLSNTDKSINSG